MKGFKPTTTGIPVNETRHTFHGTGITTADVGKAATLVTGGADVTVKLAGDGNPVLGQIEAVEIETTGEIIVNVLILGGYRLRCATNAVIAVGDTVVGAGAGLVKAGATASTDLRFVVTEASTIAEGFVGVLKL